MHNLRDIFTVSTMKQLYNSFIFKYVIYCLEVWVGHIQAMLIQFMQCRKTGIRIIANAHYNEHTNNNFNELISLNLFHLLKYKTGWFT